MPECPVLETDRLRLRRHCIADFDACAAMWSDPAVVRHIGGRPFTPEETWARLLRYVGHWTLLGYGFWAIEEKATGAFIGEAGFADFRRGIPFIESLPEMGWVLQARAHGKGYGAEALRAALAWGGSNLPALQTACIIDPENDRSIRLAEKMGFTGGHPEAYKDHWVLAFTRKLR